MQRAAFEAMPPERRALSNANLRPQVAGVGPLAPAARANAMTGLKP